MRTETEQRAAAIAQSIIDFRSDDIEDRADVKWYMAEMDIPEYLEDRVWTRVCAELGV